MTGNKLIELFAEKDDQFSLVDPATWAKQAKKLMSQIDENQIESQLLDEISEISDSAKNSTFASNSPGKKSYQKN